MNGVPGRLVPEGPIRTDAHYEHPGIGPDLRGDILSQAICNFWAHEICVTAIHRRRQLPRARVARSGYVREDLAFPAQVLHVRMQTLVYLGAGFAQQFNSNDL